MIKRLVITIEGVDEGDLETALNEVTNKVAESYSSGFDTNDTGAFHFDITDEDEPLLAWTPPEDEEDK